VNSKEFKKSPEAEWIEKLSSVKNVQSSTFRVQRSRFHKLSSEKAQGLSFKKGER